MSLVFTTRKLAAYHSPLSKPFSSLDFLAIGDEVSYNGYVLAVSAVNATHIVLGSAVPLESHSWSDDTWIYRIWPYVPLVDTRTEHVYEIGEHLQPCALLLNAP